jgi:V8-like Glu-specific endopeptidase
MSKYALTLFTLSLFVLGCGSSPRYPVHVPTNTSQGFQNALDSVVAMVNVSEYGLEGPYCTAFFISETDLITAGHCVLESTPRLVATPQGLAIVVDFEDAENGVGRTVHFVTRRQYDSWTSVPEADRDDNPSYMSATVLAVIGPDEADMALLRLTNGQRSSNWMQVRNWQTEGTPAVGETVYALSMPVGEIWELTMGIISRMHTQLDGLPQIHHDARIGHGSSGSPLLDALGNVIGVNVQISYENVFSKASPSTFIQTLFTLHQRRSGS